MIRGVHRLLGLAALAAFVIGCAARPLIGWPDADRSRPFPHVIGGVPFYPQEVHQCGPASLAMALAWSGIDASPETLAAEVFTPARNGSLQAAMVAAVRRHGRIAYRLAEPNDLITEVAAGHPVVVLQNLGLAWYPVWHYSVVIGWDAAQRDMVLHSGTTPFQLTAFKTFERTWARSGYWGLLVLPPSQLPAAAKEEDYLTAVSQLERLGLWSAAVQGYRSALTRWPHSLPATVGIGVCLYRMDDLAAAEAHLRTAGQRFPREGVVFNNLAQVLLEQGRREEALAASLHAVACGGPLKAYFEETLEEVRTYKKNGQGSPRGE